VTTVPDIPVVHVVSIEEESSPEASRLVWAAVDLPRARRPSPVTLAALGVVAGVGAMAIGAVAIVSAGTAKGDETTPIATTRTVSDVPDAERRALALLAKPSTERIVFRASGGRLVLAVGTGGRAAILPRGLEHAVPGQPYRAWVVAPGAAPVRAASFVGTERAVLLSVRVGRLTSVVVSKLRPVMARLAPDRLIARRG